MNMMQNEPPSGEIALDSLAGSDALRMLAELVTTLVRQQTALNAAVQQQVYDLSQHLKDQFLMQELIDEQAELLVCQDREHTHLVHDVAELTVQLARLSQALATLDERLGRLELSTLPESEP